VLIYPNFSASDSVNPAANLVFPCSFPCYQGIWLLETGSAGLRPPPTIRPEFDDQVSKSHSKIKWLWRAGEDEDENYGGGPFT